VVNQHDFSGPDDLFEPHHDIGNQMAEPMLIHLGISREEARNRSIKLLESVGIPRQMSA